MPEAPTHTILQMITDVVITISICMHTLLCHIPYVCIHYDVQRTQKSVHFKAIMQQFKGIFKP